MKEKLGKILCRKLGRHKPEPMCASNGMHIISKCKYCKADIIMGWRGNWIKI